LMELVPDHSRGLRRRLGLRLGVNDEYADLRRRVVVRGHGRRELLFTHGTIAARRPPRSEQGRCYVEDRGVRIKRARRPPTEHQLALRNVSSELTIAKTGAVRLFR